MIYNPLVETMPRENLRALQLERLKKTVSHAYANVPMYRQRLNDAGIAPDDIRTLEDLRRIPFTIKNDLRENYPYGLVAVPMREIVRLHASSGTTGKSIVAGYTKDDLDMWAECIARLAVAAGARDTDIVQISFGYSLFTGAFGLHYGLEKLGATIIPISGGNTERQIQVMRDFGATALVATPSYAMYLAEVAEKMGMMGDIKLRLGLFGAEGSTLEMRQELARRWGIVATENYGLTEIIGPGVAGECEAFTGQHFNEDFFLPEIINPETGEVLPEGEEGELVITTLAKRGQPMLRYRTRDITRLHYDTCACGRTSVRMEQIKGRSDDMLIIRGVNVFPSQIESVLLDVTGIGPHYEIEVTRQNYLDRLTVKVEVIDGSLLERFRELEALAQFIHDRLRAVLNLDVKVQLVSPSTLKRFEGKAKRVTELRGKA
ncbi:MAG: phenylacetate--CoA ligase [Oscillospiraceae bacterium]|jgi:phenylacetate-CoA ligase|nr:phenylacetate--CoA ligase [Oscillospiraceae bacterium]